MIRNLFNSEVKVFWVFQMWQTALFNSSMVSIAPVSLSPLTKSRVLLPMPLWLCSELALFQQDLVFLPLVSQARVVMHPSLVVSDFNRDLHETQVQLKPRPPFMQLVSKNYFEYLYIH